MPLSRRSPTWSSWTSSWKRRWPAGSPAPWRCAPRWPASPSSRPWTSLVSELATLRFIANDENVVFLGPPGVGKTHLAIALGLAAIAQGQHVHFLSAGELTHLLPEQMPARLAALCKPKLLIIDEMGYLPFYPPPPNFLFQLLGR